MQYLKHLSLHSYNVVDLTHLVRKRSKPGDIYHKRRALDKIAKLIIHRSHLDKSPEKTAERFADKALGTGGKMPYHMFLGKDGTIYQTLPLWAIGPGALGVNTVSLHLALSGDFRRESPTVSQALSLAKVSSDICNWMGRGVDLYGHTEIPNSSTDPLKECPGRHISMDGLRDIVHDWYEPWPLDTRNETLKSKGWVLNA